MDGRQVSATKSNLIRLKEELRFAREGKDLLTQKREVLVMELLRLEDDAHQAREELNRLLVEAYGAFANAAMLEGSDALERLALGIPESPAAEIRERSLMGVIIPIVRAAPRPWHPTYGLAGGSAETDRAVRLFVEIEHKLWEVAEIETAIHRLAVETRKTLRRERALESYFIPRAQADIKYIEESLEEKERENLFFLKLIKGRVKR